MRRELRMSPWRAPTDKNNQQKRSNIPKNYQNFKKREHIGKKWGKLNGNRFTVKVILKSGKMETENNINNKSLSDLAIRWLLVNHAEKE